ncbi:hypothetical protein RQP54_17865 [Curvibacter sp. APW13]|uniref:hypothetical protein n=1 Tax=Curvibacter sp. APW13 TaxID=3077236 RepID=UPI0028DE1B97|nr:hypothetical protein [Curvibacter sp. APW13]MDT8992744.1 hypothetical protein [Curvibacter sp. APW13]
MQTSAGNVFMVGFGGDSVGLAVNPPSVSDGTTPIDYLELTPDEAEALAGLLLDNARMVRETAPPQHF